MPVRVRATDGSTVEFPDDVTEEEISGEMRRLDQEFDARQRARPQQARQPRPQAPQRGQSRDLQTEVTQGLAAINRGIPFAQDVQNLIRGGVSMAQGGTFQEGVQTQQQENRSLNQDLQTRRPNAAAFLEGTGNALPVAATMGAAAPQAAAQTTARGLPLFAQQTARGGALGASSGAAYAGTTGDAPNMPLDERFNRANEGAAIGGAFGAAAPAAINTVRPIVEPLWRQAQRGAGALSQAAQRIPTPAPNSVGMSGGNLAARPAGGGALRPPPAPPPEEIPEAGINFIDRMRRRERMSIDDLEQTFADARANPQGQTVVDVFGDTGTRTFRPIVQGPGETSRRAQDTARQRFQEAPARILNSIRRGLGVGESRLQASNRLDADYAEISRDLYNPLWTRTTPQQRTAYEQRIAPLLDDPIMQAAMRRGEAIFEREVRLGMQTGTPTENLARYMHYVKMGLDDVIQAGRRGGDVVNDIAPIQATELRGVRELRSQFIARMDEIVPGYQQARRQWAGRAAADDALEEGADMLSMNPEEVAQRFDQLRANEERFLIDHLRIGLADEIANATRGGTNRNVNVARALDDPNYQSVIRAAFDTPEQAAEFLSVINGSGRGAPGLYTLLDNASQWRGGSSSFANAMNAADEATQAGVEMAARAGTGDPVGAARRGVDWARNQVTLGMVERANNRRGDVALRRIDTEESRAFAQEVVRILRERLNTANAAVSPAGQAAGIQSGTTRE